MSRGVKNTTAPTTGGGTIPVNDPNGIPVNTGAYNVDIPEPTSQDVFTPTSPVPMVSPDGSIHVVQPGISYKSAIQNDWRIATQSEVDKENAVLSNLAEKEAHPVKEALNTAGGEASLGALPIYQQHQRTPEENAAEEEAENRYGKEHPILHYGAKAAGFLAPLLVPGVGEAGEAAELAVKGAGEVADRSLIESASKIGAESLAKDASAEGIAKAAVQKTADVSLGRQLAGTAANYATQGAIYSTPAAATQLAYGDPEQAAETMLWGVGLSGVLGGGVGLLGAGAKAAGNAAVSLTDKLGSRLFEKDATGLTYGDTLAKNLFQMSDKTAQKAKDRGQFFGILDTAFDEGLHKSALTDDFAGDVANLKDDAGKKIGDIRKLADDIHTANPEEYNKFAPSGNSISKEFNSAIFEKNTKLANAINTHKSSLKIVSDIQSDLDAAGSDPSFSKTRDVFEAIMENKGAFERNSPQAKIYETLYSVYTNAEKKGMQDMFSAGAMPEKYPEYLKQLQRFTTASVLEKGVNDFKGKGKISSNPFDKIKNIGDIFLAITHPVAEVAKLGSEYAYNAFRQNKAGLLGGSVAFLRKTANDPVMSKQLGGFMAKAGQEALQTHLGNIPSYLSGSKLITNSIAASNPYSHIIGDTTGLSKDQQYNKLTAAITKATVDTDLTATKVGNIASTFSGTSINLASLVASKKLGALNYLQSQIPKNPNPSKPFEKDEWKPTKQQQIDFLDKVRVVNDPMSVFADYQKGYVNKNAVMTLKTVYPKIYNQIVQSVIAAAYDPRTPKLTYNQTMNLTTLTGMPMNSSMKNISNIQNAVSNQPQQSPTTPATGQHGKGASRPSRAPKFDKAPSLLSSSDSRLYGHK